MALFYERMQSGVTHFHLAQSDFQALTSDPKYKEQAHEFLAVIDFVDAHPKFLDAVAARLFESNYSAVDDARNVELRRQIVTEALAECGETIPASAQALLAEHLVGYAKIYEPGGAEHKRLHTIRISQVAASLTESDVIALTKIYRREHPNQEVSAKDIKRLYARKNEPMIRKMKGAAHAIAAEKMNAFVQAVLPDPERTVVVNAEVLYAYLESVGVTADAWPTLKKYYDAVVSRDDIYSPDELRMKLQSDMIARLHGLRRQRLVERRKEAEAFPDVSVAAARPDALPSVSRATTRPAETRRRRAARVASEASSPESTPTSKGATTLPTLSEEEADALLSRRSPSDQKYERFLADLDRAEQDLSGNFKEFRANIVSAIQRLEAEEDPRKIRNLEVSRTSRFVYRFRPLGTRTTHRLFLARIDGEFYLYELHKDVKSGDGTENRIINRIDGEAKQIGEAWKREEK